MDEWLANPLVLPLAGGLVAVLIGFGAYRWRKRQAPSHVDSSYLESKLQPDSFFGASGGQNVDTAEAAASGSSMMYSPSQLDAGGDVDPVAEADVYLAYGRDLQAEEILKEALRINPTRVSIHSKLLEIYAKRRDVKGFEVLACEVYSLTSGAGPEWEHACTLGQELDPPNPLYQPGGSPAMLKGAGSGFNTDVPLGMANTQPFENSEGPSEEPSPLTNGPLDLDLDFSAEAPATPAADPAPSATPAQDSGFDFPTNEAVDSRPPPSPAFELSAADLSFDLPADAPPSSDSAITEADLSFDLPQDDPPSGMGAATTRMDISPEPSAPPKAPDSNLMAFDVNDLSLDVAGDESVLPYEDIPEGDPLETKLSLAAEFMAIGDLEGARSLAEEVVEQASGRLKEKAKAFLVDLG